MTISTSAAQTTLAGNGATTAFTFNFVNYYTGSNLSAAQSNIQVIYMDTTGA